MKRGFGKEMVSQEVGDATDQDDWDMQRLGKTQQFKRNFRFYSILGFTTTLMATWESILLTSTYGLTDGGRAGMVYVYIGSFVGFFSAVISMAEIASIGYLESNPMIFSANLDLGWLSVLGWQAAFASICYLCGTLIQGLLVFNYSDPSGWVYSFERWHGTLLTIAIAAVGTVVNTWGYKILPPMEGLILAIHIFGFVAVVVPMWVMSPGQASGESVWKEFTNSGEWPSMGLACLVGQLTPIFSWTGPDAATHMAEEVQNAALVVPWCMVSTALINGGLGFIMLITLLYNMGDIQDVLAPASGFSFLPAVNHATGSVAATNGVAAIILVMEVCSAIGILATVSRQTFAFARDEALPFSKHLAHVNRGSQIPVCSVLVSTIITVLLSLINIGSTAAFNAVASVMIAALFTTYILPIAAVIRVRFEPGGIPPARFSLGVFGLAINVFSLAWLCFAIIFTFFPTANHPTPVDMNWSILVFGAVVIFAIVLYIVHGRRVYRSPVTQVRKVE
ncbi:Amino acid/polyamine transporter I [Penicillium griseofulvum]|uniref:Amino acid/polyamine transporter I n=1 Tax=Penicillium patulum TaxID=5078 RepID=A0A135LWQ5_PENPA|nr:Amino acid/polyamine transporter I [Penicillium griseofulvum]KXG53398.1 Amino acid/polyamine transporter I [Penicillium griseofulvum]